ncbi:MAG: O-antigen ligase family protein [Bacteroidota bacterium]
MKEFLKKNQQFIFLMLSWMIAGHILKELAMGVVILSFILLKYKNRYEEIIIAFCFLLLLSDNRHHEYDFAKDTKDIILVLLSVFALFDSKHFREKNMFFYPFVPFIVLGFIMTSRHPVILLSFQKTLSYALMFAVIPNYFTKVFSERPENFLRMFFFFFTLVLFTGLTMTIWNPHDAYLVGRFNGMLGNPNGVGTYCTVLALFLGAAMYHFPTLFTRNELITIIGCIALSVLLSGSRNAIFSILMYLFFRRFYKISYYYGFVIVIVAALLFQLVSQFLPIIIVGLGLGDYLRVEHLDDGSGRLIAWNYAWEEIQRNLLFGRGFSYDEHYFMLHKDELSALGHQGGVHNTYLSIWMNTGIAGLILFLTGLLRSIFKASANCYLALPALFAILFSISFESWLMGSLNPFTIVAILTITLMQIKISTHEQEEKNSIPVL